MKEWSSDTFFKAELRTIQEVSEYLRISRRQIYRLRDRGLLEIINAGGRSPRVKTKSVKNIVS